MKTMEERYQNYLDNFGLAYQKPLSFEEFAADTTARDEKDALIASMAAQVADYRIYVEKATSGEDIDDVLDELRAATRAITKKLYNDDELLSAHYAAIDAATKAIKALRNPGRSMADILDGHESDEDGEDGLGI